MTVDEYIHSIFSNVKNIMPLNTTGGSIRKYFRIITKDGKSFIVVQAPNVQENEAFFQFTNSFEKSGINVPHIINIDQSKTLYTLSDLGDVILFDMFTERNTPELPDYLMNICKDAILLLTKIQFVASKDIDYQLAYPVSCFDKTSMMWDLNYFKYCMLKPSEILFSESALEQDFIRITDTILSNSQLQSFVYRDFQSRNIMVNCENGTYRLYFIDYQGGRKGICLYDLASFISQSKANFTDNDKNTLIDHYYNCISQYVVINRETFNFLLCYTILFRVLQTLGAYGFRGIIQHKQHFISSLLPGIHNLSSILQIINDKYNFSLPELKNIAQLLENKYNGFKHNNVTDLDDQLNLTLTINSFSYKHNEIPTDNENGGGFVFDCRGLPNPYRIPELRPFPGNSKRVSEYLDSMPVVDEFIRHVIGVTEISVTNYIERNFNHLMISFGCTGGKHRSVYCAERIAEYYRKKYNMNILVKHLSKNFW